MSELYTHSYLFQSHFVANHLRVVKQSGKQNTVKTVATFFPVTT